MRFEKKGTFFAVLSCVICFLFQGKCFGQHPAVAYSELLTRGNSFSFFPGGMGVTGDGTVYYADSTNRVSKLAPDGTPMSFSAPLPFQSAMVAVGGDGAVYVTGSCGSPYGDPPQYPNCDQLPSTKTFGNAQIGSGLVVAKLSTTGAIVYIDILFGIAFPSGMVADANGGVYIATNTHSGFPTTVGSFQSTYPSTDPNANVPLAFKIDGSNGLAYSTWLGGTGSGDQVKAIAVDSSGNLYLTGNAVSSDFPGTTLVGPKSTGGFLTKLNANGSATVYSVLITGALPSSVTVDSSGNAYIAGAGDSNLTTTAGAYDTTPPSPFVVMEIAFAAKVNAAGSTLVYCTYLDVMEGYDHEDWLHTPVVAVNNSGSLYVVGGTRNEQALTVNPVQAVSAGAQAQADSFIAELTPDGSALSFASFLGGPGADETVSIGLDSAGSLYLGGMTGANLFPATAGMANGLAAFVSRINTSGGAFGILMPLDSLYGGPFPATQLQFGGQPLGSSSASMRYRFGNYGGANLAVTAISTSGDYSQTNDCPSTLTPGASCTISVTFSPTAPGDRPGALTVSENAGSGSQVGTLDGTGTIPKVSLSPSSLSFGVQAVGTTSASQTITLTNTGDAPLLISNMAIQGDFSAASTCGAAVQPANSCTIQVAFVPTASGSRSGTLTFTDNALDSPQIVQLSGGNADFSVIVATGGSSTSTVTAGQSASYKLALNSAGFSGTVSLACAGAPANAVCSVTPGSLAPSGSGTVSFSVNVTTAARSTALLFPHGSSFWLAFAFLPISLVVAMRNHRNKMMCFAFCLAVAMMTTACAGGGGGNNGGGGGGGTPAGTYTLTISASSGSITHSMNLSLVVN